MLLANVSEGSRAIKGILVDGAKLLLCYCPNPVLEGPAPARVFWPTRQKQSFHWGQVGSRMKGLSTWKDRKLDCGPRGLDMDTPFFGSIFCCWKRAIENEGACFYHRSMDTFFVQRLFWFWFCQSQLFRQSFPINNDDIRCNLIYPTLGMDCWGRSQFHGGAYGVNVLLPMG